MKICVCGKGGSGKSTVLALLAVALRERGKSVLVVDSDESNACLHWMLGFDQLPVALMELAGGKMKIQRALRSTTVTPGAPEEKAVLSRRVLHPADLPPETILRQDGLGLVCIGKIHRALEGCACPMGVLCREFLKKLQLDPHGIALVDMEAGLEHFGRGVETSVDAVIAVVEPSLESVSLAGRIRSITAGTGALFAGAVLNKIDSDEHESRLAAALESWDIEILGEVPFCSELTSASLEGTPINTEPVAKEIGPIADSLLSLAALPAVAGSARS